MGSLHQAERSTPSRRFGACLSMNNVTVTALPQAYRWYEKPENQPTSLKVVASGLGLDTEESIREFRDDLVNIIENANPDRLQATSPEGRAARDRAIQRIEECPQIRLVPALWARDAAHHMYGLEFRRCKSVSEKAQASRDDIEVDTEVDEEEEEEEEEDDDDDLESTDSDGIVEAMDNQGYLTNEEDNLEIVNPRGLSTRPRFSGGYATSPRGLGLRDDRNRKQNGLRAIRSFQRLSNSSGGVKKRYPDRDSLHSVRKGCSKRSAPVKEHTNSIDARSEVRGRRSPGSSRESSEPARQLTRASPPISSADVTLAIHHSWRETEPGRAPTRKLLEVKVGSAFSAGKTHFSTHNVTVARLVEICTEGGISYDAKRHVFYKHETNGEDFTELRHNYQLQGLVGIAADLRPAIAHITLFERVEHPVRRLSLVVPTSR